MDPFAGLTDQAQTAFRKSVPFFFMGFLFLLNVLSFSTPLTGLVKPPFVLMAIYYWAVFRPTFVPPWFVFAAGLLLDALSGLQIGLNAFVFVAVQWVARDQRRFLMGQSFWIIWLGFVFAAVLAGLLQWLTYSVFSGGFAPVRPIALSIGLGALVFPVVSYGLYLTHKTLPSLGKTIGM